MKESGGDGPIQPRARLAPSQLHPLSGVQACCLFHALIKLDLLFRATRSAPLDGEGRVTRYTASVVWKRKMGDGDDRGVQRPAGRITCLPSRANCCPTSHIHQL